MGGGSDHQIIILQRRVLLLLVRGSVNNIPMETGTSTVIHM